MLQQRSLLSSVTTIDMINNHFFAPFTVNPYLHSPSRYTKRKIYPSWFQVEIETNNCRTIKRALENPVASYESKLTLN